VPYLTPDSIPEDDTCRPLFIPADSYWLALVSGALTELTQPYNWQKFGSLTVAETVARMQEMINTYYDGACETCETPGGYRIIRINNQGHVEELGSDGAWQDASGEYHIPPPEAREGGTEQDQICLAASNAVNVLEQLYENLSDSWSTHLDDAEAQTAFILGLTALVGFEFAPITWGIVAFFTAVFSALYTALEFIGADLWDSAVSDQIKCFLVECATNTDGVVTFDYECFIAKLTSLTNNFSLTESQLRLYLQITYILYFIGGIDGLNLAGGTTEITEAECDCNDAWCYTAVFNGTTEPWALIDGEFDLEPGLRGVDVTETVNRAAVSFNFEEGDYDVLEIITAVYASGTSPQLAWVYPSGAYELYTPGVGDQVVNITGLLAEGFGVYRLSYAVTLGAVRIYSIQTSGTGTSPMPPDNC